MPVTISQNIKKIWQILQMFQKVKEQKNVSLPSYAKKGLLNVTSGVIQNYRTYFPHQKKKHYNFHKCSL